MSQFSELLGLIGEANRAIEAQANNIENTSKGTQELMDLVSSNIDGAPSSYVDEVKAGIDDVRKAFSDAIDALSEAQAAMYSLSS
jgi:methyl-accepting chemotaxis protein